MENKITIVYSSCLMSKKTLEKGFKLFPKSLGLEVQKYHRLVVEGLRNNGANVQVVSSQPGLWMIDDLELNEIEDDISFNYLLSKKKHFAHIDIAKQSYRLTKSILEKEKPSCVICDVLNYSVALGSVLAARKMKVKAVGIITDFPEGSHPKGSIKIPLIWNLIKKCDAYVVLTKQMLDKLNKKKKNVVIEGQADVNASNESIAFEKKFKDFTCLYAGSVHERYGIKNLVNGFLKANIPNSKLIIYGGGDYADSLKLIKDKCIDYRGIQPNEIVLKEEQKATLLINPRPTNDSYVLYSFPSKTIEYMTTGTPVLTTKLPGIPGEYFDYLYSFEDYSEESIAEGIKNLSMIDKKQLYTVGNKARAFVLNDKNNNIQSKKILDMILG